MLQTIYIELLEVYTQDKSLVQECWTEIEISYTHKKRYYHNLLHLNNLWLQLNEVKTQIADWDTVLFTLFYHDLVYNALKSDNEEQSAKVAEKRMNQLGVPANMIANCKLQILATKKHVENADQDTNYFTDADLSILGQSWVDYQNYYQNVRKEYAFYPDIIYNHGRKKVLNHFLAMERIFKTALFFEKFEKQAKENLQKELQLFL